MYKLSYRVMFAVDNEWATLKNDEGEIIEFNLPSIAQEFAIGMMKVGIAQEAFAIKVEQSVVYDVVTRREMFHTQYTGLMDIFRGSETRFTQ